MSLENMNPGILRDYILGIRLKKIKLPDFQKYLAVIPS